MKRFLWLGLLFLSTSWLFFIPIFTLPDYNIGIILLIIGIICSTLAFWKHDFKKLDKKYLVLLIPLLISLLVLPLPYSIGPIVLTVGILLYGIKILILKNEKANWIFLGISFSGVILTVQTLFLPIYAIFVSHGHRVDILSPVVSSVGGLFGLKASLNEGAVFVQTLQHTYSFTTTWEKLGFFPWFNILIGALLLFCFLPKARKVGKYILGFLLLSGVYFILRYVFIMFVFTQTQDITLFWNPVFYFLTFIPFALLLIRFIPLKYLELDFDGFKNFKINKNRAIAMMLVFIFVFSLVGAFVFQDPGTRKNGRILIDEVHSDWENSADPLNKEKYGMLTTYNYYGWAEWLDKHYTVNIYVDTIEYNLYNQSNEKLINGGDQAKLTSDLLNDYDILILKCPTNSYSDEEISDIVQFVYNGGGLYFIGDHTNVFGMNYYLNLVSENFGITFKTDATYELETGMLSIYEPDVMFPHPVVQNMEQFDFLTSCTLGVPITSENIIIGNRLLGEPGTYSTENFFRESRNSLDMEYGLLLQVAAVKHGKGRVLAFTDSTCFSNFCIFMDGYQDFNLGTMEYLNRINTYSYLNTVLTGIAIVTLILSMFLLRKERKTMIIFLFLVVGLLSFSIAAPAFSHINTINYSLPSARSDYTKVCFDEEHSGAVIAHRPSLEFLGSNKLYDTFFVWTQRVDCIPSLEKTLEESINKGDVVVIINPVESFDDGEVDAVVDYIEKGGNVLLMDSALNMDSTANELLNIFDISLSLEQSDHILYKSNNTALNNLTIGNISTPYLMINGGDDVFVTEKNETSIAVVEKGEGKIVVVIDSYTFNNNVLGGTFAEPDESLRQIYNTEFYIFEELLLK